MNIKQGGAKMNLFTTREIAIFIYSALLLVYIIVRKKSKDILLPVLKAACHMKIIIPFCAVIIFSAVIMWGCTYLPIWYWRYAKDIVFWTIFVGVPVCFNATNRQLEENYFKDILVDNLKLTALAEFITGTFTFSFIVELILQPALVLLMIMQSSLVEKTDAVKKIIEGIVVATGLTIIVLTIKSMVESIGEIYFMDIVVGLTLPIMLSIIYLPIAYFFALCAKYEILFMRMGFKEPDNKKIRRKHRFEVIRCCQLSYKKVCRFLNEYVQKMYVKMSASEFEAIINEFRGTTEHTYYAVIRYNRKYYISRTFTEDSFKFNQYTIHKGGLFNSRNKALRKEIALQIQEKTPFKNTEFNDSNIHHPVSLRRMFLFKKGEYFKRTKVAFFISNSFEKRNSSVDLPFCEGVREQSDKNAISLIRAIKRNDYLLSFVLALLYFAIFLLLSFTHTDTKVNLDIVALVFSILCLFEVFINKRDPMFRITIKNRTIYLYKDILFKGLQEVLLFGISLSIAYSLGAINIDNEWISKFSISLIFLCILIGILKKEQ